MKIAISGDIPRNFGPGGQVPAIPPPPGGDAHVEEQRDLSVLLTAILVLKIISVCQKSIHKLEDHQENFWEARTKNVQPAV